MSSKEIFFIFSSRQECELCKKSFTYHHDLLRHRRTIHGEKSFECNLCLYKTARKDMLYIEKYTPKLPLIKPLTENVNDDNETKIQPSSEPKETQQPSNHKRSSNHPTLNLTSRPN